MSAAEQPAPQDVDREALAKVIYMADPEIVAGQTVAWPSEGYHGVWIEAAYAAADAVLAAGFHRQVPRTVTMAEELDALPVGSVVLDRDGDAWQDPEEAGLWSIMGGAEAWSSRQVIGKYGPFTVLHVGGAR